MTNVKRGSGRNKVLQSFNGFKVHSKFDIEFALKYYETLNTATSLMCAILLRYREYEQLARVTYDVDREIDPHIVRDSFAAVSLLRKYKGLKTGIDTKEVAIESFHSGERTCAMTNRRFRDLSKDRQFTGPNVWLLNAITRKIERILGNYRPSDFFSCGSWGPGSSIGLTGDDTSAVRKFRCERQITSKLHAVVAPYLPQEYPNWFPDTRSVEALEVINWSELLTVHKNALTDRTIFKEAGLTTWFQKSLGSSIRERLLRYGYDLNSTERSWSIARESSKDGQAATVDFRNASNTVAKLMVREIVSDETWYYLLDACRTPCYSPDKGKTLIPFEMFSSMGNGFTFELESLIFVAAAEAVHDYYGFDYHFISVHGDDITVDSRAFELYRSFCEFLGFEVNTSKSFHTGYFRESCGSYFYNGLDVKPIFLKEKSINAKSIYKLANRVSDCAYRRVNHGGRDIRFRELHSACVSVLPDELKLYGASIQGDVVIHSNLDEATPCLAKYGHEGYLVTSLLDIPVTRSSTSPAVLLARLWYPSKDMAYKNESNLRGVTKTCVKRVFVHQWCNLGPWTHV